MRKIILLLCFVSLFSLPLLHSTNYYASPDGSGTGTIGSPCNIATGISKLRAGSSDTLFLRSGIYYQSSTINLDKAGTASARLAIFAYPGEEVIVDFSKQSYSNSSRGFQIKKNYWHIKGIRIQYAGDNGMHISSSYNIIEECVFFANCDTGLQITGSATAGVGNLIKNCDSYSNFDYKTGSVNSPDFGGNADGYADKLFDNNSEQNTYEGCRAWNNSDDGWDFYNRRGLIAIHNSWCYKNGPATYDMRNHPRYNTDKAWFDQFTEVQLASYTNYGNGNGFKLGGDYRNNKVTLINCLAAENTSKGFDQNNNAGTMTVYNCTGYNNGINYGFTDRASNHPNASNPNSEGSNVTNANLEIKNCVSLGGSSNSFTSGNYLISEHNSWNTPNVTCTADDFLSTTASAMTAARKTDGSLPNITFMYLAENSDLIDAGLNVGLPYSGNAPDIGCFEAGDLSNYPPAVSTPENRIQSILQEQSISPITFTWSAGATGLTHTGLPAGINAIVNNDLKTLTLSGTPSESGVYNYTVTTVGGTGHVSVNGIIVVGSADAKRIAYVTIPGSEADATILNKLLLNPDLFITIENAATENDYSGYDLLILSSVPNSSSTGLIPIENLDKPKLLLKPFQLGSSRWNWGTAVNTNMMSVTIPDKTHEIFKDLTFTGAENNELILFSAVSTNGVTGISSWVGTPAVTLLGNTKETTTQSIVEIPVGTDMNGTTVNSKFVMIGLSEYSTANLTTTATQLIENTCYYLLGIEIPASIENKVLEQQIEMRVYADKIIIEDNDIAQLSVYDISGSLLNTVFNSSEIFIGNLNAGVYIIHVKTKSGVTMSRKFIK